MTDLTLDDVEQLPPTVGLLTAARMLGVGRTAAYELVRTGKWPTPVLRLGRAIRIPTAPLLAQLGLSAHATDVGWPGHLAELKRASDWLAG